MMKFPKNHSFILWHNDHKSSYQKIEEYLDMHYEEGEVPTEDRQEIIKTDELWELQWYPITPISFYRIAAPTWKKLCELIDDEVKKED